MGSLYARYKGWVRRNNSLLSILETGLSSLTWVLPDRFAESELALEAVHTAVNLLSTFHDSIVNDSAAPAGEPRGAELVFLLGALQQVQVLVELGALAAERTGHGSRYDALAAVEGLKTLLRMLLLYRSGGRLLTNGGLANFEQQGWAGRALWASPEERANQVVDAFARFRSRHCDLGPSKGGAEGEGRRSVCSSGDGSSKEAPSDGASQQQQQQQQALWWQGADKRGLAAGQAGGGILPSGVGGEGQQAARTAAVWAEQRQARALRLVVAGEVLHILRPLAYTLALRRWGRASWRPWLASLAVDLLSMQLTAGGAALSRSTAARVAASPALKGSSTLLLLSLQGIRWGPEERDELTRRKLLLLYYLLRDPLFARHTAPALRRWQGLVGRLPLAGWLTDKVVEVVLGMQQYYSYTAAS